MVGQLEKHPQQAPTCALTPSVHGVQLVRAKRAAERRQQRLLQAGIQAYSLCIPLLLLPPPPRVKGLSAPLLPRARRKVPSSFM